MELVQEQLDQLEKENNLIMEKASYLLQNLRFRRSKKAVVAKRVKSPTGSEIFHSFENIELDDVDKASIRSADL
jgi:hypothetical protein